MHIPESVNISSLGERQLVLIYFWAHLPHNLRGQVVYPATRYPQLILPPESTSAVTVPHQCHCSWVIFPWGRSSEPQPEEFLPALLHNPWHPKQAKVCDDHLVGIIEHILRLQVLVNDVFGMQIPHTLEWTQIWNSLEVSDLRVIPHKGPSICSTFPKLVW